ncbi:uncharacterized protein PgNI_02633 [Pyricularia grisea]|uniref:AMP-dependent synthetase/ligase domain-containing protein n=1 Tax=Pyricularia grisea TaxID=148305 RepID=A0A6P8BDG0_PYRGI|nr:uncharacterized protein PgNI_02633 [Pyricularia grisea]TLD13911.1 hypothetical protein PgNI_02633 [Pyricularia grisea]
MRMTGRMEPRRLRFLLDSFTLAVTAILERPQQLVFNTQVMGDAELCFLRDSFSNRDTLVSPPPQLLQAEFEAYTKANPSRVAIGSAGAKGLEEITYADLDSRANNFATMLVGRGLQPGDRVAVMLDKSVKAIVCILGILKAGLTNVPLDPENPVDRNAFICRDVSPRIVVMTTSKSEFSGHLPGDVDILFIEDISSPEENVQPIPVTVTPNHLAYILYTSGSTGQPKGVMVPHRTVATGIRSICAAEGRASGEWRCSQISKYVFDHGGTICMSPTDDIFSDMAGFIRRMNVSYACITPTVAGLIRPADVPNLKTVTFAGEAVTKSLIKNWAPGRRIFNSYGPTKTSVIVCTKEVKLDNHEVAG